MSDQKKHNHVSEKELDNLLNQAFLNLDFTNPKNEELMETISQEVMQPRAAYINLFNKSLFTKLLSLVAVISLCLVVYFVFFKQDTTNQTIKIKPVVESNIPPVNPIVESKSIVVDSTITHQKENPVSEKKEIAIEQKKEEIIYPISSEPIEKRKPEYNYVPEKTKKVEDTSYVFPKLNEKEIKEIKRQKEVMSLKLEKTTKNWYPLIGNKKMNGNLNDTTAAFYIASSEVSNLEYRTFVLDLILQDRKEDFLKAKPHQELWLSAPGHANGRKMKDSYFSDKKYNDYPVVNITPEGAELYCQWLNSLFKSEEAELHARLPYESEWLKAAKGLNSGQNFPWKDDSIQNKKGCHLANFCIQKSKDQIKKVTYCTPKNAEAYSSAEYMLGDSVMTAKVFSYNPNDNGLFCIIGNVAEMVYKNIDKQIVTKGGSWNSDVNHCKLNAFEELTGNIKANSMTGFRPIFRYAYKNRFGAYDAEDPKTGLTTLYPTEIKVYEKEKKKMIDALIRFDKTNYSLLPSGSCIYKNDTVSIQSFYMQTTEVTNLQYRTFLADLLTQNRTADYLIAKPNQEMWVKKFPYSYNEPMQNMYFWHPAYDNYPVINISRKGAEMYCEWLTIETNKVLKAENRPLINDLRIPVDIEWAFAASNKKDHAKYATGKDYLRDIKDKYEANYSCYHMNECRYDTAMKLYLPQSAKMPKNDKGQDERILVSDGAFHTTYTKSYQTNSYGLYCMAGNVSEMVNTFDLKVKKITGKGTKGGSWFSCDYYLEIDADEEYPGEMGPSPLIGFRPVITFKKN